MLLIVLHRPGDLSINGWSIGAWCLRVVIVVIGTYGDVEPLVALGRGLQQAGHTVTIATTTDYELLATRHGLHFWPLGASVKSLLQSVEGRAVLESGRNIFKGLWHLNRLAQPLCRQILRDSWRACQRADAVIFASVAVAIPTDHIRRVLGIPCFQAVLMPLLTPTRQFAHPNLPPAPLWLGADSWAAGVYNLLTHWLVQQLVWRVLRRPVNHWRQVELGLPPLSWRGPYPHYRQQQLPVLHGYSRHVIPTPADWPDWQRVTGYWFLNPPVDWQPPPLLVDFLQAGPPPVCVSFGSMSTRRPELLTGLVQQALRRARQRAILITAWGGLSAAPAGNDDIFVTDFVPFAWLLPRVSLLVHHGGAGSTAAALRAGVPSVVVPFFAEQPFWGRRVAALGVGPPPILRHHLTAQRLAGAIETALRAPEISARAARLGRLVRAEDGVARAVEIIQQHLDDA